VGVMGFDQQQQQHGSSQVSLCIVYS
jgi:hypothetical protein